MIRWEVFYTGEKTPQEKADEWKAAFEKQTEATELIKILKERTQSKAVYERCKRFLGE